MVSEPSSRLREYLRVCVDAARAAASVVKEWSPRMIVDPGAAHVGRPNGTGPLARAKGAANDLVTQADLAAQEAVRQTVLGAFPHHAVLGEEEDLGHDDSTDTEFRWIVDPIDGTTNFVHGVPHYCVSLALERRGRPLVGAVQAVGMPK